MQVGALSVNDPNQLTAFDIVDRAASTLQSESARQAFLAAGLGILLITDLRAVHFVDDRGRHEMSPSFDFVLTYEQDFGDTNPGVVTLQQSGLYGI
jgi:hypothetical protein